MCQPSTADKLEERGWGQILKESDMMQEKRQEMLTNITQLKEKQPAQQQEYDPKINPNNFVSTIDNKFLTLTPGTILIYESEVEEGVELIEFVVTDEKRTVMGVETTVVWDREWLNDELIEDTKDWFAQDSDGNVWYFGEDSKEFYGGKLVSTKGSWEAGIDGAKPGIVMMASPQIGESYIQEYYSGEAEDMAQVISMDETVSVHQGTFSGCLKIKDWNPLEYNSEEFKYYCPQIGGLVLEEKIGDDEAVELIAVTTLQESTIQEDTTVIVEETPIDEIPSEISEEQAIDIASKAYDGRVTEVGTEYKFGQFAWVIEMQTSQGEIDVVIDKTTGEILGIER